MMKHFGTDGIRKKSDQFTTDFLGKVALGLRRYATEQGLETFKVLVGGDTRESTEWILRDFEGIFEALGVECGNVEILPTPGINYVFYAMGYDFAIDVTASHNQYMDNGLKILERGEKYGQKLGARGEEIIEEVLQGEETVAPVAIELAENLHNDALTRYKEHLRKHVEGVSFEGLRIGVDCANGATGVIGAEIFREMGAEVELINSAVEFGRKINAGVGSTHLEVLQKLVQEKGLDFGVAYDGDGDRCLMIDDAGETVTGDGIIVILAEALKLDKLAVTVMSNQGVFEWAKNRGVELTVTNVGDINVSKAMREKGIELGGEECGHVIVPGQTTGDGMLTSLLVTKVIAESKKSLRKLSGAMQRFPQVMVNLPANSTEKKLLSEDADIAEILKKYEQKLDEIGGRILVRPSGTEEVVRLTMWGKDDVEISSLVNSLAEELRRIFREKAGDDDENKG